MHIPCKDKGRVLLHRIMMPDASVPTAGLHLRPFAQALALSTELLGKG
jgi:hypothetical protein